MKWMDSAKVNETAPACTNRGPGPVKCSTFILLWFVTAIMWGALIYLCFILFPHENVGISFQFLEGMWVQEQLSDKAAVAGGSSLPTHANYLQWLERQTNCSTARTTTAHTGVKLNARMNCKCSFNHCIINREPWFCFANKQQWNSWNTWAWAWTAH